MSKARVLKVVLLGDGGVGKSSLMNRFVSNKFDTQSFHTIGVEFLNRDVMVDGQLFTLQIWDTAGQERFKSLRTPFYRGADCCLLTFGVDDLQSFKNVSMWKKEFLYYADVPDAQNFPFVVIGNKIDIPEEERQVTSEEAKAWCAANTNVPYFDTSAKDSTNVESAFIAAVKRLVEQDDRIERLRPVEADFVDLNKGKRRQGGCC